jgi:DNA-binding Xre family transcriptional regulator
MGGGEIVIVQKRIAEYLVRERKKPTAIADDAGIRRDRFSLLMNCKSELRADELEKICIALGTSPSMFVCPNTKKE